jgi:DNA polymerase-3 subunit delta
MSNEATPRSFAKISLQYGRATLMASVTFSDFQARKRRGDPPGVIAIHGDSHFLRREARRVVHRWVLGAEPNEFAYSNYEGDDAGTGVLDELFTPPFLGDRRLVIVEQADDFVSRFRPRLEKLARNPSSVGVLLLDVRTWAVTTKLAQAVELAIQCSAPRGDRVPLWCQQWSERRYEKAIDHATAHWLVESAGVELGVLDQELAKLATFVGDRETIVRDDVTALVAGRGADNIFAILDAALDKRLPEALRELDRVLAAGEPPVKVLAILSAQLRKYGEAFRRKALRVPADVALRDAGMPPFVVREAERRLGTLDRERGGALFRQLLSADYAMKGGREEEPRTILERLLVWLATGKR